jgi:hypothetical protein
MPATRPAVSPPLRLAAWILAVAVVVVPVAVAVASPLQAYRDPIWIVGGLAGVAGLALLFVQPVLIGNLLPGLHSVQTRPWHRWAGSAVMAMVLLHVGALYVTSPEDITDALLLVSPTPFALYGVIGLVGVVLTALIALVRTRLPIGLWRAIHVALAAVIVAASVVHAVQIEGVMGEVSKWVLCVFALAATAAVVVKAMLNRMRLRRRASVQS